MAVCQTPLIQDPPDGIVDGVNVLSAYSAIFQLRAPGKDYVHLRGDFNGFAINNASLMHQSVDGTRHWLQVDGLNPYQYWRYHFLIEGSLEVGDPYAELVLDPWNDGYIPGDHFPNLPDFPFGQANWPNAVVRMQANAAPYQVYDAAGKLVQPWSSALEIDVRDWLAGTYIAVQANGQTARFNVAH